MIFCFFLLSLVFLQPLFANGFWTQYNRYFGTPKHLASEFHKSPDALNVKYTIKRGTEIIKGEGICISASDAGIVLLEEDRFHFLNKEKYTILEVMPEHIGKQLLFQTQSFFEISVDSLNNLVRKYPIQSLEVHANFVFEIINNNIFTKSKSATLEYPNHIYFKEIPNSKLLPGIYFFPNPKIQTYQNQIILLNQSLDLKRIHFHKKQAELKILQQEFYIEKNISKKEAIFKKIKLLEKELEQSPKANKSSDKIIELKQKTRELQQLDYLKLEEQKAKQNLEINSQQNAPTFFSGSIVYIILK